jgi:hypothetical protein
MTRHDRPAEERHEVDALHSTVNGLAKSGMVRTGVDVTAALRASKAAAVSSI